MAEVNKEKSKENLIVVLSTALSIFIVLLTAFIISRNIFDGQLFRQLNAINNIGDLGIVTLPQIGPYQYNSLLYIAFLFVFFITTFLNATLNFIVYKKWILNLRTAAITAGIFIFVTCASFQWSNQLRLLQTRKSVFAGKSTSEKNSAIFGQTYEFAEFCRSLLPGYHHAQLLTDLSFAQGTTADSHRRALRYHLYPIDIDGASKKAGNVDSFVIWHKSSYTGLPDPMSLNILSYENHYLAIKK